MIAVLRRERRVGWKTISCSRNEKGIGMHLLFRWFRHTLARISAGWRWFWRHFASLSELFAAAMVLLFDVDLLSFLLDESFVKNLLRWPFPQLTLPLLM